MALSVLDNEGHARLVYLKCVWYNLVCRMSLSLCDLRNVGVLTMYVEECRAKFKAHGFRSGRQSVQLLRSDSSLINAT